MASEPVKVEIRGYIDSRLRELIEGDANKRDIPVSEAVAQALAKAYNRPDLGKVPRKRIGRPLGTKITSGKKKSK